MRRRLVGLELALWLLPAAAGLACKQGQHTGKDGGDSYMTVRLKDGGETRVRLGPGTIPPEFPPGTALYPGAEHSSTARTADHVVIVLTTPDPVDSVLAFYRRQPGYQEISDVDVEDKRVLHVRHVASGKDLQVVIETQGRPRQVSLVVRAHEGRH
jgi:hypothetical protein